LCDTYHSPPNKSVHTHRCVVIIVAERILKNRNKPPLCTFKERL
jgi:hypothetical protein